MVGIREIAREGDRKMNTLRVAVVAIMVLAGGVAALPAQQYVSSSRGVVVYHRPAVVCYQPAYVRPAYYRPAPVVQGYGYAPAHIQHPGQAVALARRAATVDAQRRLLTSGGGRVTYASTTTVCHPSWGWQRRQSVNGYVYPHRTATTWSSPTSARVMAQTAHPRLW